MELYSDEKIRNIKDVIEKMDKTVQLEVLKIIKSNEEMYSENKNGIFINLSEVSDKTMKELDEYVCYINTQEQHINIIENQKQHYKHEFFDDSENSEE